MITKEQILEFVEMSHKVGAAGLTQCSSGNLSWRIGDEALAPGTGSWVPDLKECQVAQCKVADGEVLNGIRPSMESVFHLGIMRERPDVNVVLHFQSPYATTIACMEEIPTNFCLTAEIPVYLGKEVPNIPYLRPGSPELAEKVIEVMKDHNICILRKHGQVVCGKDFNEAFQRAVFFEMVCRFIVQSNFNYVTLNEAELEDIDVVFFGKKK